jgi:hypothetical protein
MKMHTFTVYLAYFILILLQYKRNMNVKVAKSIKKIKKQRTNRIFSASQSYRLTQQY